VKEGGAHNVKKYPLYITIVWIALGVFVSIYAYKLGMGKLSEPGPGFIPFWLGIIVSGLALLKLVRESRARGEGEGANNETVKGAGGSSGIGKLVFIAVTLLAYALALDWLGYIITTLLAMILLLRFSGYTQWIRIAVYSIVIVGISYLMFRYLGVQFPAGVLSHFGLY
jgi:putative tricarboxylic transport membrane protein